MFLQTIFFARRNFTQSSFYTAETFAKKPLRTKKYAQQVLQTDGFYTESSPHKSLTHRRFYAQHFLHTDVFTHRCLYTDASCTQKLVHTARVYTQPTFTRRGFASPSWSPTFGVPPLKWVVVIDRLIDRLDSLMWCFSDMYRLEISVS